MSSQLNIWCNQSLSEVAKEELRRDIGDHNLTFATDSGNNLTAGGPNRELAQADVAFGQPDVDQVIALPNLAWVHLTSAGYTRYDRDDVRAALRRRSAKMTNSSSVYDDPCAQHLLAFMLAQARQLPQALLAQFGSQSWEFDGLRPRTQVLKGQTVLIVGFGAIGKRLAELLAPFHLNLIGLRRTVTGDEPVPVHNIKDLDRHLPLADHVVNVLPAHASTDNAFDETQFALMKPGAVFYNIGRGTTVDQQALIEALRNGHLAAAYLDVTEPEPLPADAPLWQTPNCFITPHIGGGHGDESITLVDHFLANLRRFESGEELLDRII